MSCIERWSYEQVSLLEVLEASSTYSAYTLSKTKVFLSQSKTLHQQYISQNLVNCISRNTASIHSELDNVCFLFTFFTPFEMDC